VVVVAMAVAVAMARELQIRHPDRRDRRRRRRERAARGAARRQRLRSLVRGCYVDRCAPWDLPLSLGRTREALPPRARFFSEIDRGRGRRADRQRRGCSAKPIATPISRTHRRAGCVRGLFRLTIRAVARPSARFARARFGPPRTVAHAFRELAASIPRPRRTRPRCAAAMARVPRWRALPRWHALPRWRALPRWHALPPWHCGPGGRDTVARVWLPRRCLGMLARRLPAALAPRIGFVRCRRRAASLISQRRPTSEREGRVRAVMVTGSKSSPPTARTTFPGLHCLPTIARRRPDGSSDTVR